jgi:hypothetical protein
VPNPSDHPGRVSDEMLRRVRYWLGKAEDALDQSVIALDSVRAPLDGNWRGEYGTDAAVIKDKLATVTEAIKRHP